MNLITKLNKAINSQKFINSQLDEFGDKNILFVNPQLSGKCLYQSFLPYFKLFNDKVKTAITNINKYNPVEQLTDLPISLDEVHIIWADFIILPFTLSTLTNDNQNLYYSIKSINPNCRIIFTIDFNFYELSKLHPYYNLISKNIVRVIEDNILFSDFVFVNNANLHNYLFDKLSIVVKNDNKYRDSNCTIVYFPFFIDKDIVLENVDFNPNEIQKNEFSKKINKGNEQKIESNISSKKDINKNNTKKQIRVIYSDKNKKWEFRIGKSRKAIKDFANKKIAINYLSEYIEKGMGYIIYKKNGEIQKQYN